MPVADARSPDAPIWVVIVAAGDGARFGGQKQFAELRGSFVVDISLATARSIAFGVVLVLPASTPQSELRRQGADEVVRGGATRSESVRAGLAAVPVDAGIVVIHDGARPLASLSLFQAVVDAVRAGADAAVPAIAVGDTLKRIVGHTVISTVQRADLVAVQTPQAFDAAILRRAHSQQRDATDDASLVEDLGATVVVVPGESTNIKLTTRSDLTVAEVLMKMDP